MIVFYDLEDYAVTSWEKDFAGGRSEGKELKSRGPLMHPERGPAFHKKRKK